MEKERMDQEVGRGDGRRADEELMKS